MLPGDAIANLAENFAELEKQGAAEFAAEGLAGVPSARSTCAIASRATN